jgi:septal ring factor EnvC (AmiA/AmiB activator)
MTCRTDSVLDLLREQHLCDKQRIRTLYRELRRSRNRESKLRSTIADMEKELARLQSELNIARICSCRMNG